MFFIGVGIMILVLPFFGFPIILKIIDTIFKLPTLNWRKKFGVNCLVALVLFVLGEFYFIYLFGNEITDFSKFHLASNLELLFMKEFYLGEIQGLHIFWVIVTLLSLMFNYQWIKE